MKGEIKLLAEILHFQLVKDTFVCTLCEYSVTTENKTDDQIISELSAHHNSHNKRLVQSANN